MTNESQLDSLSFPLQVRTWYELSPIYQQLAGYFDILFGFLTLAVFILVFFIILQVLTLAFLERTREIGTIRALGTTRGQVFSQLLVDLDILASYSRPRVSDDNPYSESHFKTLKYAPPYPGRFSDVRDAEEYCQVFFPFYNTEHRHSGLGLMTPEAVHYGQAAAIQQTRQQALDAAYAQRPERFVHGAPQAPQVPSEVWINRPERTIECADTGQ